MGSRVFIVLVIGASMCGCSLFRGGVPQLEPAIGQAERNYLDERKERVLASAPAAGVASSAEISAYLSAAFARSRGNCQDFFDALTKVEQDIDIARQVTSLASGATMAVLPQAGAGRTLISALGAAFGFSTGSMDALVAVYIISPETGPVHNLVARAQETYATAVFEAPPSSLSAAIEAAMEHQELCTPKQIRRLVSEAIKAGRTDITRPGAKSPKGVFSDRTLALRLALASELGLKVSGAPPDELLTYLYWLVHGAPSDADKPPIVAALKRYGLTDEDVETLTKADCAFDAGEEARKRKCLSAKSLLTQVDAFDSGVLIASVDTMKKRLDAEREKVAQIEESLKAAEAKLVALCQTTASSAPNFRSQPTPALLDGLRPIVAEYRGESQRLQESGAEAASKETVNERAAAMKVALDVAENQEAKTWVVQVEFFCPKGGTVAEALPSYGSVVTLPSLAAPAPRRLPYSVTVE